MHTRSSQFRSDRRAQHGTPPERSITVPSLIVVIFALSLGLGGDGPLAAGPAAPQDVPEGWLDQVQRAIQLEHYAVLPDGAVGVEYRAANPAHRFESRFAADGVRLTPTDGTSWQWGLSLRGWGRPGQPDKSLPAQLSSTEDRVELDRGSLIEWFVNTPEGLEHGFTIPAPPAIDGGTLGIDITLTGDLRPVFAGDGQAVDFFSSGNVSVLRYAKLIVTDATGETLPARMEPIDIGIRIVIEDAKAAYPITVDPLATTPAWTAVGEAPNDWFGYSAATAGDVNADGYADVVVAAHYNGVAQGKVYLYLGGASGLATSPSWTAVGEAEVDFFGRSVATAGDVNGDGYSDVVIGATEGGTFDAGKAYLYLGTPDGLAATPSWTAEEDVPGNRFGNVVATAGDVNGDGYSDVVVSAPNHTTYTGMAYLYLGGPGGLQATPSWTATGEGPDSYYGTSVGTAGDVNGDGYADLIVGSNGFAGSTGRAYVYLGSAGGLDTTESWIADGEATGHLFGGSVSTAGDTNGDGYADVVVGARGFSGLRGKAYLFLGGPDGLEVNASWFVEGGPDESLGFAVATAGDVNGDGYSDVLFGARALPTYEGRVYLYLGEPGGLAIGDAWSVVGENPMDELGYHLEPAGDVNGDGYSDIVIGAYGHGGNTGKAYLYLGAASSLADTEAWTAIGGSTFSDFGSDVAPVGDVNGDGFDDVIVGERGYSGTLGKAHLYLGEAGGLASTASWVVSAEGTGEYFGHAVSPAGDVNGDGYADAIVGAYGHAADTGKAYLYLGGPGGLALSPAWTATGETAGQYFAYSVATAGDVNGDGYSDVVIGAYRHEANTGKAYVYLGGPGGLATTAAWTATGEGVPGKEFGYSVATAGDVNGDGYADVAVGAPRNTGVELSGKAYLYLGAPGGLAAGASWIATGVDDFFGGAVATAGDVNGDGYADLIVGARLYGANEGMAYLFLGGAGGLAADPAWTEIGGGVAEWFGYSVGTAGDLNGDGYGDVLVSAPSLNQAGTTYLYLGSSSGLSPEPPSIVMGEAPDDQLGFSASTAGDVNGDGYSDVVVGAVGYSSSTGKAYLYLGNGGAGVALVPRQLRADLSAPIHVGGTAHEQQFRLGLTLRSPVGRVWRRLEWQVAPLGGVFTPLVNPVESDTHWFSNPVARSIPVTLDEDLQRYIWRARVKYHPGQSPFVLWSPWFTLGENGLYETDLVSRSEAAPPPCSFPDEELYISDVTLDGNGKPVLHYQDPNQPASVTGYNVYRSVAPTGPWTLIASNVVDMDEGTPNAQYVDQAGDVGGSWYYQVAAWNDACGVEGPC